MKTNAKEFQKNINNIKQEVFRGIQIGIHKTLIDVKKDVIAKSMEQKSGRQYKIKTAIGYKIHTASSPSEHYAKITGKMNRSIYHNVNGLNGGIGASVEYAKFVELGTRHLKARKSFAKSGRDALQTKLANNIAEGIGLKMQNK
jgi:hypothetical protein